MNLIGKVTIIKNIRKVINYRHTFQALWLRQKAFCMKFFHHNKQKKRGKRRHNRNVYLHYSKKGDEADNLAKIANSAYNKVS